MNRSNRLMLMGLLLLLSISAAACSGGAAEPVTATAAPTPTAAPPTATPVPPTPVPPTAVPPTASTTSSGGSGALSDALKKAQTATAYHLQVDISGKGSFSPTGDVTGDQELQLLGMTGAIHDKDSDVVLKGFLATFIGGFMGFDATDGLEIMSVEGKSYVKGKKEGATQATWYVLPADQAQSAQVPLKATDLLDSFNKAGLNLDQFSKSGRESLDGQSCDLYAGDKDAVIKAFKQVGAQDLSQSNFDPSTVESAELKFYVCDDGYLHQVQMAFTGHDKDKPDQKGSFKMLLHIFDINGEIKIQAPANAEPIQIPGLGAPTPTP